MKLGLGRLIRSFLSRKRKGIPVDKRSGGRKVCLVLEYLGYPGECGRRDSSGRMPEEEQVGETHIEDKGLNASSITGPGHLCRGLWDPVQRHVPWSPSWDGGVQASKVRRGSGGADGVFQICPMSK